MRADRDAPALIDEARADDSVLSTYQQLSTQQATAAIAADRARAAYTATPTAATEQALVAAQAELARLDLQLGVAKSNYEASQAGGGIPLDPFSAAESWGSDRRNTLLVYVFGGALLGALVGMALATLAANRWQLIPTRDRPGTGG